MAATSETLSHLFDVVRADYPESVGAERWYLIAASALITNPGPSNLGQLWVSLINQPEYKSLEKRKMLNTRLREFLLKQWITIGVPKVVVALFSLIKEEQTGDADLNFTKRTTALTHANRAQGERYLAHLYTQEQMTTMWTSWGQKFEWLTKEVVYGMLWGDHVVLDTVDTQFIDYTAIVSQGLKVTVRTHLGGLSNMGLNVEEINGVTRRSEKNSKWAGVDTADWPDMKGIVAEFEKQ